MSNEQADTVSPSVSLFLSIFRGTSLSLHLIMCCKIVSDSVFMIHVSIDRLKSAQTDALTYEQLLNCQPQN